MGFEKDDRTNSQPLKFSQAHHHRDGRCSPSLRPKDVFRQLLEEEVRSGRLTKLRRRRIVRYGARLGLSAVEVGELVSQCREQFAGFLTDSHEHGSAANNLPLPVEPSRPSRSYLTGVMAIAGGLILLLRWMAMLP